MNALIACNVWDELMENDYMFVNIYDTIMNVRMEDMIQYYDR